MKKAGYGVAVRHSQGELIDGDGGGLKVNSAIGAEAIACREEVEVKSGCKEKVQ